MQPNKSKLWVLRERLEDSARVELSRYSPVMQQILFNRGITTREQAQAFLSPDQAQEHNPYDLLGMQLPFTGIMMRTASPPRYYWFRRSTSWVRMFEHIFLTGSKKAMD
jgi:hypothetical protein